MSAKKAIQLAKNLLFSRKALGNWEIDHDVKEVQNLLTVCFELPEVQKIWDWDIAVGSLQSLIIQPELTSATSYTDADAEKLVKDLLSSIDANASHFHVIIPLCGAHEPPGMKGSNFRILPGDKASKISAISKLTKKKLAEMKWRAEHTTTSRSNGFFEPPLLVLPFRNQHNWINLHTNRIALMAISCLRVAYCAANEPPGPGLAHFGEPVRLGKAKHIVFHSVETDAWGHSLMRFETRGPSTLNWLEPLKQRKNFDLLLDEFVYMKHGTSPLHYRFLRSIRYFAKAEDAFRSREIFEGLGQAFMFIMIALESLLLSRQVEIRVKLTVYIPELVSVAGRSKQDIAQSIDMAYRWRSDFVHDGTDILPSYGENFEEGPELNAYKLLKVVTAKLLNNGPSILARIRSESSAANEPEDSIWFKELKLIWERKIGLQ